MKDPNGVGTGKQLKSLGVIERNSRHSEVRLFALNEFFGIRDDVEVAQPEDVHFQQPQRLHPVHFVLGNHWRIFGLLPGLGFALNRQILSEWFFGDNDGCSMNPH